MGGGSWAVKHTAPILILNSICTELVAVIDSAVCTGGSRAVWMVLGIEPEARHIERGSGQSAPMPLFTLRKKKKSSEKVSALRN